MSPEVRCAEGPLAHTEEYSAAYERMRACVIEGAAHVRTDHRQAAGLGLVLREGVAGWLKTRAATRSALNGADVYDSARVDGDSSRPRTAHATAVTVTSDILPLARQPDLTLLIANMVVSTRRARHPALTGVQRRPIHLEEVVLCS